MSCFICVTCGVQFAPGDAEPDHCPVCEDGRQYAGWDGQRWTTLEAMRRDHANRLEELEPGLTGIGTEPSFAIGQRALLVQTPEGNVLWDCITLLDEATVAAVRRLGGIVAIAISHPHYYSSMVEWSREFGAPIHLHEADRRWVMRPDPAVRFFSGDELALPGGLRLLRLGGHFPGATVLHWPAGAGGRGALLSGDVLQVVSDRGTSASCTRSRTSCRCRRTWSSAWSGGSPTSGSTASTVRGGAASWTATARRRCAARRGATSRRWTSRATSWSSEPGRARAQRPRSAESTAASASASASWTARAWSAPA